VKRALTIAALMPATEPLEARFVEAERRVASYRPRLGDGFAFEAELQLKRRLLGEIERDLAATEDPSTAAGKEAA
jgi:hypothetical protein